MGCLLWFFIGLAASAMPKCVPGPVLSPTEDRNMWKIQSIKHMPKYINYAQSWGL